MQLEEALEFQQPDIPIKGTKIVRENIVQFSSSAGSEKT
jgi:hypothetical protein